MKQKKTTYQPKNREVLSNPYRNTSHHELLNKAKVGLYNGNYEIVTLLNGKITLKSTKK